MTAAAAAVGAAAKGNSTSEFGGGGGGTYIIQSRASTNRHWFGSPVGAINYNRGLLFPQSFVYTDCRLCATANRHIGTFFQELRHDHNESSRIKNRRRPVVIVSVVLNLRGFWPVPQGRVLRLILHLVTLLMTREIKTSESRVVVCKSAGSEQEG